MSLRPTLGVALTLFALPACIVEEDDPEVEAAFAKQKDCGDVVCGNGARIDGQPLWVMDEKKQQFSPGTVGFKIKNFRRLGTELNLVVSGNELIGVPVLGGAPLVRSGLVNATMDIVSTTGAEYQIKITGYNTLHQHEDVAAPDIDIPAFQFKYIPLAGVNRPFQFVCPAGGPTTFYRMAIVYQGDLYDPETGEVVATGPAAEPWFNIACSTSALWKLVEFRYTEATQDAAHQTDAPRRTAALRSITADYCGIGHPFTQDGTFVDWANSPGWLDLAGGLVGEALWKKDGSGAACLNTPRFATPEEVEEYCDLDPCGLMLINWWNTYEMYTKVAP